MNPRLPVAVAGERPADGVVSWGRLQVAVLAVFLILLVAGMAFHRAQEEAARRGVREDLEAVSSLKVEQIVQWRHELLGNAEDMASQPYFADTVARWLRHPNGQDKEIIARSLGVLKQRANLSDVNIVDTGGQLRLNLERRINSIDAASMEIVGDILASRRAQITGLHPHAEQSLLENHVDAIAPLVGSDNRVVGALILESDASDALFPLLNTWPTGSRTSETLLVRRDGDSVVFLNARRHRSSAPMPDRLPLDRLEVPAVNAVLGREGIFEGRDYRGEPVVAMLRRVPDSPWFLVTKTDAAEAYADWRLRSRLLAAMLATLALSTLFGLLWLRRGAAAYRQLREHKEQLADVVAQRTRELQERNSRLAVEVVQRKAAEAELQKANVRLAGLATEQAAHLRELASELTRAEQCERDRLQALLHDEVQPLLVAARLGLTGIGASMCGEECVRIAAGTCEHITKVIATARTLSTTLSPPLLRERGLIAALESLARQMGNQYGLAVDFAGDPDAEPEDWAIRLLCFNAVRELLVNAVKHAGTRSAELTVALDDPDFIRIAVADGGRGFDPARADAGDGSGLRGIERRLVMVGGRLLIDSRPGIGTTATLWAPRWAAEPEPDVR